MRKLVSNEEKSDLELAILCLQQAKRYLKRSKELQYKHCHPRVPHHSINKQIEENVKELKSIIKKGWVV